MPLLRASRKLKGLLAPEVPVLVRAPPLFWATVAAATLDAQNSTKYQQQEEPEWIIVGLKPVLGPQVPRVHRPTKQHKVWKSSQVSFLLGRFVQVILAYASMMEIVPALR